MQGSIGSWVCRSVRSRWADHRIRSYQRLPATTPAWPAAARGVRLGRRRPVLVAGCSTAWSFRQLRAKARWSAPLQLLGRIVGACLSSVLPRSLKAEGDDASAVAVPRKCGASPPKTMRRAKSRHSEIDRRAMMLNLCVAEVLLRRSSSEVRRSPLRARKAAFTEC